MLHTLRFSLQNAVYFIRIPFLVHVLFTFYIQDVLKFKCKIEVCKSVYRRTIAVFVVGPAGPTTNTARLSPRYEGKARGWHCSHWALDDGRENAPNML